MKKFDLELAKQGHPLIISNGTRVNLIGIIPNTPYPIILERTGTICRFTAGGNPKTRDGVTLQLDDSIDWLPPLKQGDVIEVLCSSKWQDAIYICKLPIDQILVVWPTCCLVEGYKKGEINESDFAVLELYDKIWRRKVLKSSIEITVKVNGKESKLSDISEETLLKIREEN